MNTKHLILLLYLAATLSACGGSPSSTDGDDGGEPDPPPPGNNEDTTPPSAPGNFNGESGEGVVTLFWSANSEGDLEGYNLYRSDEEFNNTSSMNPINGSSLMTTTEYTDEDLQNGTTYYYRLSAVDDSGNESNLSSLVEVTPFSNPPNRP